MIEPWRQVTEQDLSRVKGICLDIDETLSTRGKLTDSAYQSLWKLKQAGYFVVPITGRPAGWCDHFARFWPVDAVVGENGAFTFYMSGGKRKRFDTPMKLKPDVAKKKLKALEKMIVKKFKPVSFASDQSYREFDLAVDICEDVKPWAQTKVKSLLEFCEEKGAHAKLSSIHVNIWFGDYNKAKGFESFLKKGAVPSLPNWPSWDEWLFIGDSPNDEPLFEKFEYSVGVANLAEYQSRLKYPPRWITDLPSGEGFSEMAKKMTSLRVK